MENDSAGPAGPNRAIYVDGPVWPESNDPDLGRTPKSKSSIVIYLIVGIFILVGTIFLFFPALSEKKELPANIQTNHATLDSGIISNVVRRLSNLNSSSNQAGPTTPAPSNTSSYYYIVDTDKDDIPDRIEIREGTDPRQADTDQDGLNDLKEIYVFQTDPKNKDTDGDSYLDGAEVTNGYNPNGPGRLN